MKIGLSPRIDLLMVLPKDYPCESSTPHFSIESNCEWQAVSKYSRNDFIGDLQKFCMTLDRNSPYLYDLIYFAKEKFGEISASSNENSTIRPENFEDLRPLDDNDTLANVLLKIDHMRQKKQYCRIIENWVAELDLKGRLIFVEHQIFLFLEGSAENLKRYLLLHRTSPVDVDSNGQKCRERMMTEIFRCENSKKKFKDFLVLEFVKNSELISFLNRSDCSNLIELLNKFLVNR